MANSPPLSDTNIYILQTRGKLCGLFALERAGDTARHMLVARRLDVPTSCLPCDLPGLEHGHHPEDQPNGIQRLRIPPEYGYPGTGTRILSLHGMVCRYNRHRGSLSTLIVQIQPWASVGFSCASHRSVALRVPIQPYQMHTDDNWDSRPQCPLVLYFKSSGRHEGE